MQTPKGRHRNGRWEAVSDLDLGPLEGPDAHDFRREDSQVPTLTPWQQQTLGLGGSRMRTGEELVPSCWLLEFV